MSDHPFLLGLAFALPLWIAAGFYIFGSPITAALIAAGDLLVFLGMAVAVWRFP